jgi:glutaryl-CoA transferase
MYAVAAILAAVHARSESGEGQHIDLSLFDTQVSWLINQGTAYLTDRKVPPRRGNEHPTIVPYGTFPASDGDFIIAVGNDSQFAKFCQVAGSDLAADPRFTRNVDRVKNRDILIPLLNQLTVTRPAAEWIAALESVAVPCGPINDLGQVFDHPQVKAREMQITLPHPVSGSVDLIGNPIRMSRTPVEYQSAPPVLGADTEDVLREILGKSDAEIERLRAGGALGGGE